MKTKIENNFIWDFCISDNIFYNFQTLQLLYKYCETGNKLLYKPIIIILASIIEAVFFDFFQRINNYVDEYLPNLSEEEIGYIQNKESNRFSAYAEVFKKKKVFGSNSEYYSNLEKLIKLRNRIHIQNEKGERPEKEKNVFSSRNKKLAEKIIEYTLKFMSQNYYRPKYLEEHLKDFELPWTSYFKNDDKVLIWTTEQRNFINKPVQNKKSRHENTDRKEVE